MKTFRPFALGVALLLVALVPVTAQARPNRYYASVHQAIRNDLRAIPVGTPATDAQKLALSGDLSNLFPFVYPVPTVTIDLLADRLADAVSTGAFAPEDNAALARELVSFLGSTFTVDRDPLSTLQATLVKAQVETSLVTQIAAALTSLQYSSDSDYTNVSLGVDFAVSNPGAAGYERASGDVSLNTSVRPTFHRDGSVDDPASLRHDLAVRVNHLPPGKYRVFAITSPVGEPVELGTFHVRGRSADAVRGNGYAYFNDADDDHPLPAGLMLKRVTTVRIVDAQGIVQFTGSPLVTTLGASTTRYANLHLLATAAAPVAGGAISLTNVQSYDPYHNFTFVAVGLPANATLTLSVDGNAVEPVRTGPTGNLYVKTNGTYLSPPPKPTETVNLLPDSVDLSVAGTFTLSDAQGNLLASAGR